VAQICVSLTEGTTRGVIDRMAALAGLADLFEVRGDLISDLDLLQILRARTRPLIFACRPVAEGGQWDDGESRRRRILLEAVKRGYDYVDVEYRSDLMDVAMEKAGNGLIVSYHDMEATPEDLEGLYVRMCDRGADVVKIAVMPRSVADVGRVLMLAERVAASHGKPLVAIALGPLGVITRVVGGRYHAPFTYAAAAPGAEAAPGQVPVELMAEMYRVRAVTPATRVYGVVGGTVRHSLSPLLHNRAFAARQLDAVYVPLQAEAIEPFVRALPALGLAGFSVTRPYKVAILPHLHEVEDAAAMCGSVNTVVVHEGTLRGSTTDGIGVVGPLKKRVELKGKAVVIVGAGGAARAAALSLRRKGARVTLLARNPRQAAEAAAAAGCAPGSLEALPHHVWDILINATPVGSASAPAETPVPGKLHRRGTLVLDMVYDPLETRLLREARAAGCTTIDGLEMLLAQAVVQFETWTGLEAPVEAMRAAAARIAQEQEA
jgi:3-dehydroquinate dehydratase / shikimate dehydrogenase